MSEARRGREIRELLQLLSDEQDKTRALVKSALTRASKKPTPLPDNQKYVEELEAKYRALKQRLIMANLQVLKLQKQQSPQ
jgi:hypothetical protein